MTRNTDAIHQSKRKTFYKSKFGLPDGGPLEALMTKLRESRNVLRDEWAICRSIREELLALKDKPNSNERRRTLLNECDRRASELEDRLRYALCDDDDHCCCCSNSNSCAVATYGSHEEAEEQKEEEEEEPHPYEQKVYEFMFKVLLGEMVPAY